MSTRLSICCCAVLASISWRPALAQSTTFVDLSSTGVQGGGDPGMVASVITPDGRWIAFTSAASSLVSGDSNGVSDVFVRDRVAATLLRASLTAGGAQGNGASLTPSLSSDARYVAFESDASNLVAGDTNQSRDIFVRDLVGGTTVRVDLSSTNVQANGNSYNAAISADGRFVAFESLATNLVSGDTNGFFDIFVRDLVNGQTTRVSVSSLGAQGDSHSSTASISADGRYVAFWSSASNFTPNDLNGQPDVFVHDLQTGATVCASLTPGGQTGNGASQTFGSLALSSDGGTLVFTSVATNLVAGTSTTQFQIYARDLAASTTTLISASPAGAPGNGSSIAHAVSADGRYVAFASDATNLSPLKTQFHFVDVYLRDRQTGAIDLVSLDSAGLAADSQSGLPSVSQDGRFIAFASFADNLVPDDKNGKFADVLLRDRAQLQCPNVATYCVSTYAAGGACLPTLSTSGQCSASSNQPFLIVADQVPPNANGLFIYSVVGPAATRFHKGTLCLAPPLKHATLHHSSGSNPCGGNLTVDFNRVIASGQDPALVAGAQFWGQFVFHDPITASLYDRTYAVTTYICP